MLLEMKAVGPNFTRFISYRSFAVIRPRELSRCDISTSHGSIVHTLTLP